MVVDIVFEIDDAIPMCGREEATMDARLEMARDKLTEERIAQEAGIANENLLPPFDGQALQRRPERSGAFPSHPIEQVLFRDLSGSRPKCEGEMASIARVARVAVVSAAWGFLFFLLPTGTTAKKNLITGEMKFEAVTYVEKKAGVWVDGQYLGYLKELKGKRKIVLLPGEHQIIARRAGYDDFVKTIVVEPGQGQTLRVLMYKTRGMPNQDESAKLKFSVKPRRAAVFLDDQFMGPASDFGGSMKVTPGQHSVKIELPGYRTYETSVDAVAGKRKSEVKVELAKGSIREAGPLMRAKAQ
jgi:hypothetical protein